MDDLLKCFDKFNDYSEYYIQKLLNVLKNKEYSIIEYNNLKIVNIKNLLIYLSKECLCIVKQKHEYTFFIDDEYEIEDLFSTLF
jgi:hypothetical protein